MNRLRYGMLVVLLSALAAFPVGASGEGDSFDVEINEICSSNGNAFLAADGSSPDWVELHNPADRAVDLTGYFLSKDEDSAEWYALEGYVIGANGYLLLAADGREMPFKLSAGGCSPCLLRPDGSTQALSVPALSKDTAYAMQPDGVWHIVDTPTPGAENTSGALYVPRVPVAAPVFSHASGFYDGSFALTILAPSGCSVYYTLDGSVPNADSALYSLPLMISDVSDSPNVWSARTDVLVDAYEPPQEPVRKSTIIRAIALDAAGNASDAVTATYFVGFSGAAWEDISYLSIIADPYDLFDEQDGIYVLGKTYRNWLADETRTRSLASASIPANYRLRGRESEIRASVQYFDPSGRLCMSQALGLRVNGNYSRERAEKSFKLYARGEYGSGSLEHVFWSNIGKTSRLTVRSSGGLKYTDAFAHTLLSGRGILTSQWIPCVVFLNGEYWGFYTIRETQDEEDIAAYYGLSEDDLIVSRNNEMLAGTIEEYDYPKIEKRISQMDCSRQDQYDLVQEWIDVDTFITYMAGLTYIANTDGMNDLLNVTRWRTKAVLEGQPYGDARWRWTFQDLDNSCRSGDMTTVNMLKDDVLFSALWANDGFQTSFLTCLMDMANLDFAADTVLAALDETTEYVKRYIGEDYERYGVYTMGVFTGTTDAIRSFFQNRREGIARQLSEALGIERAVYSCAVELPAGVDAGLSVNGRAASAEGEWLGKYFEGCPVELSVREIPEWRFLGWYEGDELLSTGYTVGLTLAGDRALSPRYARRDVIAALQRNENLLNADGTGVETPSVRLEESERSYTSAIAPTETLTMTKELSGAVSFAPPESWRAGDGFVIALRSAGYTSVSVFLTVNRGEDAPDDWRAEYSLDGLAFAALEEGDLTLAEGENAVEVNLPPDAWDATRVYLRLSSRGKSRSTDSVTLNGLRALGDRADVSLAEWKDCVALSRSLLGESFRYIDISAEPGVTQARADAEVTRLEDERMAALVGRRIATVAESGRAEACLEGLSEYLILETDEKLASLYARVKAPLPPERYAGDTAYAYALADGALAFAGAYTVTDASAEVPTTVGTFVLLDRPIEEIRYRVVFFDDDSIEDALMNTYGFVPISMRCMQMRLDRFTEYQERIVLPFPDRFTGDTLWLYAETEGEFSLVASLPVVDGRAAASKIPAGVYLAADRSIEAGREEYDAILADLAREERSREETRQKAQSALRMGGAAAGAVLLALICAFWLRRRKRRR